MQTPFQPASAQSADARKSARLQRIALLHAETRDYWHHLITATNCKTALSLARGGFFLHFREFLGLLIGCIQLTAELSIINLRKGNMFTIVTPSASSGASGVQITVRDVPSELTLYVIMSQYSGTLEGYTHFPHASFNLKANKTSTPTYSDLTGATNAAMLVVLSMPCFDCKAPTPLGALFSASGSEPAIASLGRELRSQSEKPLPGGVGDPRP